MLRLRKPGGLAVAVGFVVAAACGGAGNDEAVDATTSTTTASSTTTTEAGGEQASITVEDPGAEPRQALRLRAQDGDVSEATMTVTMTTTMEADGEPLPSGAIPAIQITLRSEVVEVDDDADTITTQISYADADIVDDGTVDPATAEAMRSGLSVLDRLSGTTTIDTRGQAISSDFDVPDDLDPNARQMLEQVSQQVETLTVPLPAEEVGVGAVWRVQTTSALGGIETVLDLVYELRELQGSQYLLAVTYEQTAPRQEAQFEGAPAGAVATVEEYRVTGSGEVAGDLTDLLPASSIMTAGGDVVMQLEDAGERIELRQRLDFDIQLESLS